MKNLSLSINKGIFIIYLITTIVSAFGELLDAYVYYSRIQHIVILNSIAAVLLMSSLVLYLTKTIKIQFAFFIVLYTILVNSVVTRYFNWTEPHYVEVFLRDIIFQVIILVLASFCINKIHAYIIAIVITANYILLSIFYDDKFLKENIALLSFIFLTFGVIIRYFVSFLERTISEVENSRDLLKERNEKIQIQYNQLIEQSEEIIAQSNDVEIQKLIIEKKNREIFQGIEYAKTIQEAILPKPGILNNYFEDSFILHLPKERISGDFYWIKENNNKIYVAAVDCTGHGVAGALVSTISLVALNYTLTELKLNNTGEILDAVDKMILKEIENKTTFSSPIGMDIALVAIDKTEMKLQYSGAFSPLYILREGRLSEIKADRLNIGINSYRGDKDKFTSKDITIHKNDTILLFSDGYVDQFGGKEDKKYGYKRFKDFLVMNSKLSSKQLEQALLNEHVLWKGNTVQTDDLIIVSFKI